MISPYSTRASLVANRIPLVLDNRGLAPHISRFALVEDSGEAWLFAVLDESKIAKIEAYTNPQTLHQLSTALNGLPVVLSNSTGLRYAVLLSPRPSLADDVPFPGWQAGVVGLGLSRAGDISSQWESLGHALIAGMTGSGKSNMLRLMGAQALLGGHELAVIDPDGSTFPSLSNHARVIAYTDNPAGAHDVIDSVQAIYSERVQALSEAKRTQAELPQWARLVVIIDEFNSLVSYNGGPRAAFAQNIINLAYGARKFNINLVLAGHEFTRDLVGPVAGQMVSRICFQVRAPSISALVVGRRGAEALTRRGRFLSEPWGLGQAYRLDYADFLTIVESSRGDGLSSKDRALLELVLCSGSSGRVTFEALQAQGLTRGQAKNMRDSWLARGLVRYAPEENNSLVVSDWVRQSINSKVGIYQDC